VRGHGVPVALVLGELNEEVDEGTEEELDEDVDEEVDAEVDGVVGDKADEEVIEVLELVIPVVDVVEAVVQDTGTLVEVAVFIQEHPLDILDGRLEHAVAHAGSVAEVVAVVYVEQNEVTAAEDRIIARCPC
jgi:hypothetical protein